MGGGKFFVSHASADRQTANRIVAYLEARGVSCWVAPRDLPSGAPFAAEIVQALKHCSKCIVVASAAANASADVENELSVAADFKKPFIPIRIDDAPLEGHFAYYLKKAQWVDFKRGGEAALDSIVTRGTGSTPASRALSNRPAASLLALGGGVLVASAIALFTLLPMQTQPQENDATQSDDVLPGAEPPPSDRVGDFDMSVPDTAPDVEEDQPEQSPSDPVRPQPRAPATIAPDTPITNTPRARRIFDALSVESLPHPDQSPLTFPTAYFNRRLQQELGSGSTSIRQIRLGVTFVEPRESRGRAGGGTVIGYVLISLPSLPGCSRQFGGPAYTFDNASTALMGAVNDAAPDIATWIQRASNGEELTCPD
jgi:TIR domain